MQQLNEGHSSGPIEKPEWYEEGSEVYSVDSRALGELGVDAEAARLVLAAAGIPCYVEFCEDPPDWDGDPQTHRWRVLVPGNLNIRATNILDRDIFNDEFEATWRVHLQMLSEQELREAQPREVFCGLFDRIERVVKVYKDEQIRRARAREQR